MNAEQGQSKYHLWAAGSTSTGASCNRRAWQCQQLLFFTVLFALLTLVAACAPRTKSAAWIVRFDADTPEEIEQVCNAAKAAKFDHLLLQVRGRADAYYRSDIAPPGHSLAPSAPPLDPLGKALSQCNPVPIHAWLNVYYLWGDMAPSDNPKHPSQQNQPWILHDADGRSVWDYSLVERRRNWIEGIFADPGSEEYSRLFVDVVKELLDRYPVKGIHLDFIRYPGPSFGQTGPLADRFRMQYGIDPRWLPTTIRPQSLYDWLDGTMPIHDRVLTTATLFWLEFRANQVTELVSKVHAEVKKHFAVQLSAAVFPDSGQAYLKLGQDWRTWSVEGVIDALYPMLYYGDIDRVSAQLNRISAGQEKLSTIHLWAGLDVSIKKPGQIAEEASQARMNGFSGISLFSLGHLVRNEKEIPPFFDAIQGETLYSANQLSPS